VVDWTCDTDNAVYATLRLHGSLFVAGRFKTIAGAPQSCIAQVGMPFVGVEPQGSFRTVTLMLDASPNPVRDVVRVAFDLAGPTSATAKVMDIQGRTVRSIVTPTFSSGRNSIALDVSGLPASVYFVRVNAGGLQGDLRFAHVH